MPLKIHQRKDSPFWWLGGTVAGRRIRESTGTADKRLAGEIAAARETKEHRDAIHGAPAERRRFADVTLSYVEHGGPHTAATKSKTDRLLVFFGATKAADDVDQEAIDRACAALLRPNAKPATRLREIISPARAILSHGARRRMCAMPIFDNGKPSLGRTLWLEPAEVDVLLSAAAPHLRPLIAFLVATGARMSEALALDWGDVSLKHGRATLRGVLGDGVRGTKNGKDRIVELCPRAMAALRFDPRAKPGVTRAMAGRVFLTATGRAYAERKVQCGGQIKTGWAAALRRAKITKSVTPHGLRHSWASWRYAMNKDLLALRDEGGWSHVSLVQRYAHLTPPGMAAEITDWRESGTLLTRAAIPSKKRRAKSAA